MNISILTDLAVCASRTELSCGVVMEDETVCLSQDNGAIGVAVIFAPLHGSVNPPDLRLLTLISGLTPSVGEPQHPEVCGT